MFDQDPKNLKTGARFYMLKFGSKLDVEVLEKLWHDFDYFPRSLLLEISWHLCMKLWHD